MIFWIFLLLPALGAYVVQNSPVGLTASMMFDVTEAGSGYECGTLGGSGTLEFLDVNISFAPVPANNYADNFASDMFITVTSTSNAKCAQLGGYNFVFPGCGEVGKFPSKWDTNKPGSTTCIALTLRAAYKLFLYELVQPEKTKIIPFQSAK
jgi:hypothetical protein